MRKSNPAPIRLVTFTLPMALIASKGGLYYQLIAKHFGIEREEVQEGWNSPRQEVIIKCSPAQFAEFLIERHQVGLSNQFAVLSASVETIPRPRDTRGAVVLWSKDL